MKLNRKWFLVIALVLSLTMAISGTLAYLQDSTATANVMTLGSVKIEQHEYERADADKDGNYDIEVIDEKNSYVLQPFTQGKQLLPTTEIDAEGNPVNNGAGGWDTTATVRMTQVDSYGGMDVFTSKNAVDKFVTVENTGKSDAYVRTYVAIEVGSTDGSLIGYSNHFTWDDPAPIDKIEIDGNYYDVIEFVYAGWNDGGRHVNGVLPAGETTYPNLSQVYLYATATNEDLENIDGNNNGMLDILVLSQAVQADGFDNAATALNAAFGKATAENVAEWFGGVALDIVAPDGEKVEVNGEEAAAILEQLKAGKNVYANDNVDIIVLDTTELDAKDATVTLNGVGSDAYGYLAVIPEGENEDVTVSNLNVTGSGFVEMGHYDHYVNTATLENVKIKNLASTLANGHRNDTVACAFMGFGTTTLNNCVITGTTSIQGVMPVDLGCGNYVTTNVNGGKYGTIYCWSHSIVTIEGAEVDTIDVAPIKGFLTLKAGTHVSTINVDYTPYDSYATKERLTTKIVIESGATVDNIVFDDNTYTLDQWNAYLAQ